MLKVGATFDQQVLRLRQTMDNLFDWPKKNQNEQQ